MTVLSAIVHSGSKRCAAILETAVRAWQPLDDETLLDWSTTMEIGLENTPAREIWRKLLMAITAEDLPGRAPFFEEYYEAKLQEKFQEKFQEKYREGEAKDRASLILRVLERHGIPVPEDIRERVTSCTDLDTLMLWFDRSLTANTAEDLFTEDSEAP
ncbi:hypothetical protein [Streptomyces sp. NPDC002845]